MKCDDRGRSMRHILENLTEAAGGYVAGNLNRTLENVWKSFMGEVATEVNARLKKSAMFHADGNMEASMEPSGFDWPVVAVTQKDEMAYDLEMTMNTGDEQGQFIVNLWDGAMQKDTKVLKVALHQMSVDSAATFLINFVRRNVASAIAQKGR